MLPQRPESQTFALVQVAVATSHGFLWMDQRNSSATSTSSNSSLHPSTTETFVDGTFTKGENPTSKTMVHVSCSLYSRSSLKTPRKLTQCDRNNTGKKEKTDLTEPIWGTITLKKQNNSTSTGFTFYNQANAWKTVVLHLKTFLLFTGCRGSR